MEKCLEKDKPPNLTQEEIENLDICVSIRKTEFLVRYLSTKKSANPDDFTDESYQTFKEVVIPLLYKLFSKIEVGAFYKSFREASITMI